MDAVLAHQGPIDDQTVARYEAEGSPALIWPETSEPAVPVHPVLTNRPQRNQRPSSPATSLRAIQITVTARVLSLAMFLLAVSTWNNGHR